MTERAFAENALKTVKFTLANSHNTVYANTRWIVASVASFLESKWKRMHLIPAEFSRTVFIVHRTPANELAHSEAFRVVVIVVDYHCNLVL